MWVRQCHKPPMTWTQEEQAGEWRENRRVRLLKRTLHRAKPYTNRWRAAAQRRALAHPHALAVAAVQAQVRPLVARLEAS